MDYRELSKKQKIKLRENRVLTVGTFDVAHIGHIYLFCQCAELGDTYVAVNSDEFVERYKGKKPIIPMKERIAMIRSCVFVRHAFENFGDEDLRPVIRKIKPKYLVVGSDWLDKDYFKQTKLDTQFLDEMEVTLVFVPRFINKSSTDIKRKILNEG